MIFFVDVIKFLLEYSELDWDEIMIVNFKVFWLVVKVFVKWMKVLEIKGFIFFIIYIMGFERGYYLGVFVYGIVMVGFY